MSDLPSTPTDLALARLTQDELMNRRKEALQAFQDAKNKGEEHADLERAYQDLEAEHNRRLQNKLPHP